MVESFAFYGDSAIGQVIAGNLQRAGFRLAEDIASADAVFTYCLTQQQLEDAYWETDGILSQAHADACVVDLSPSTPSFAKELYALARAADQQALDAPLCVADITSEHAFAHPENLSVLVGGEAEILDRMQPMLQAIAGKVRHMGVPGCGQIAKAAQTLQFAAQLVSLVEANALCQVNDETALAAVHAAVEDGLAAPRVERLCRALVERDFRGSYTAQVLRAELEAAQNAAEDADLVLPQAEACQRLVELFMVVGGTDLNATALGLLFAGEEERKQYHLDWSRAESLYHQHEHDDDDGDDDNYDPRTDYDDYEADDGYAGGYGGFSSN